MSALGGVGVLDAVKGGQQVTGLNQVEGRRVYIGDFVMLLCGGRGWDLLEKPLGQECSVQG